MRGVIPTPFDFALELTCSSTAIITGDFVARTALRARCPSRLLQEAARQVRSYWRRQLDVFTVPLALQGTEFECAVWRLVSRLHFGEFLSYSDVAYAVGHPGAHRAVAAAMGRTPIDLFIPAHRVIGADGRLKGCAPGSMRERLYSFERNKG